MLRTCSILIAAFLLSGISRGADDTPNSPDAIRGQYTALVDEFQEERRPREFVPRFFTFAKEHSDHGAAVDALVWIVANRRYRPETAEAIRLLEKHHLSNKRLAAGFDVLARLSSPEAEQLLRAAFEKSPHTIVRAHACYTLAALLQRQAALHDQLEQQPATRKRAEQYYGKAFTNHLVSLDVPEIEKEREQLFERLRTSFAAVPLRDSTMGQIADKELFAIRHLSVGKPAPEIEGQDIDGQLLRLSEFRGNVVVVSFWGHW